MGRPMASNLANAGHRVFAVDICTSACRAAAAVPGIEVVSSPAVAARRAPIVFTSLPSAEAVRSVYLGNAGITAAARPGLVTCDCSTVDPSVASSIRAELEGKGARHLEAMGRGHRHVGPDGAACTIKALQNGLGMVHAAASGEALALCGRLG